MHKKLKIETLESRDLLAGDLVITEFMASNDGALVDGNGVTPDWIEIYNQGIESADLHGHSLTDDPADLTKWSFTASQVIEPGEFLVVFASGDNQPDLAGNLHTNFSLSAGGEYVALVDPSEALLSEYGPAGTEYPAQESDVSYGLAFDGSTNEPIMPPLVGSLLAPTPGEPNTNLRASDVDFSRIGGPFAGSFQLALTSAEAGDSIRYTTDGSVPNAASTLYTSPLTISSTLQIRARVFGAQGQEGAVQTETFVAADAATVGFTSDLPIVVLENFGEGTPQTLTFEDAALTLHEVDPATGQSSLANPAEVSTLIGQRRRGRSTASNPKTNLRIELRDENGEDKNVPLLDLPSESDWVLYAPYNFDRAMLRNTTFYDLSRQLGKWAPRTRFVEVFANYNGNQLNSSDYLGVYVLLETIKRDNNRVDINRLTPDEVTEPDVTGGYTFAFDGIDSETPLDGAWKTNRSIPTLGDSWLVHEEPERVDLSQPQVDYLRGYIQEFEDALYGPDSTDPELGYRAYFDIETSIDHHLLRLLSKEPDSLRLSTYLTKEREGKIAYGPVWDFDRSSGADDDSRAANPEGFFLPDVDFFESDWWGPLFDDPEFAQQWVERWQELRETVFSDENLSATVNGLASQIGNDAQARNFSRWPGIFPNGGQYASPGLTGWEAEVSHLAKWLMIRANWIDDQLISLPSLSPSPGNVPTGQQVTLTAAPDTDIYYTLDGSDPRQTGGVVSSSAVLYDGPIQVDQTTQINARAFGNPSGPGTSTNSSYPGNENPSDALDGNQFTKYLNFGEENSGLIVTPNSGASTVRSFRLTTANDAVERDPASWALYGTNDSIHSDDNSTGLAENWTLVGSGDLSLPSARRAAGPVVSFANSTAYTSYKLLFPTVKNAGAANSMQVADISFFQSTNGTGSNVLSAGDPVLAVHELAGGIAAGQTNWSSLVSGVFSVEAPADATNLRISELHYHPANPTPAELALAAGTDEDNYEFIELVNTSDEFVSLNGVLLSGAVDFDFTTSEVVSLAPGETVLVVEDEIAFAARYGSGFKIAGEYGGKFRDSTEQVILTDSSSETIHDFDYFDAAPWPVSADGDGPSLEVIDLAGDYNAGVNWRASFAAGGTPGVYLALPGDYDRNGLVEQTDYAVWASSYGSTTDLDADGNSNGRIDAADYTIWRDRLGTPQPSRSVQPATLAVAPTENDLAKTARVSLPRDEAFLAGGLGSRSPSTPKTDIEIPQAIRARDAALLLLANSGSGLLPDDSPTDEPTTINDWTESCLGSPRDSEDGLKHPLPEHQI